MVNGVDWWMIYGFGGEMVKAYKVSSVYDGTKPPDYWYPVKEDIYRDQQLLVACESAKAEGQRTGIRMESSGIIR